MSNQRIFIALGANLGNVLESFRQAIVLLGARGVELVQCSSAYQTPALVDDPSKTDVPNYWNAAIEVRTSLKPIELLEAVQSVEHILGRVRKKRWDSRTIDLDIILIGNLELNSERLCIPHSEMHRRAFVLEPLAEIGGTCLVPGKGNTVRALLDELVRSENDVMEMKKEWL